MSYFCIRHTLVKHIPGVAGGGWSDVDVEIRSRKSSASSPAETASDRFVIAADFAYCF